MPTFHSFLREQKKVIIKNNYYSKADQASERFISVFTYAMFYYIVKVRRENGCCCCMDFFSFSFCLSFVCVWAERSTRNGYVNEKRCKSNDKRNKYEWSEVEGRKNGIVISVCKNSMLCDGVILSVRILKMGKVFPCMRVSLNSYDGFVKRFWRCQCYRCCYCTVASTVVL